MPDDVMTALWRGIAAHVRAFYGTTAIVRRYREHLVALSRGGNTPGELDGDRWMVDLIVFDARLELARWPSGERQVIEFCNPRMHEFLDEFLDKSAKQVTSRWTPPAVAHLIRLYFDGRNSGLYGHSYEGSYYAQIVPNGPYHPLLVRAHPDRVEIEHNPTLEGTVQKKLCVPLEGDYHIVREQLLAALKPLKL
jgi:hypothetical protein